MSEQINQFLAPKSIAIIGASTDPKKRGHQALKRLLSDDFSGEIYPINPKAHEILGLKAYASVNDIEGDIDLALICTPARTLPSVVEDCGKKCIKGAVVLAGGFREIGIDGIKLENEMVAMARKYNIRLVGPNTSGVFNLHSELNIVGFSNVKPGSIGILTQSGNMALAIVTEAEVDGHIGFSTYIGVGNQADVRFDEYLRYFDNDDKTNSILVYAEGFKDGESFVKAAREVTQNKPIVLFKSGRTAEGQQSAASHTGSLSGSYKMTSDLLKQAGVTVVDRTDDLLPISDCLSLLPAPSNNRVAVLTDGGGQGVIATDHIIKDGLQMAKISEETKKKLSEVLFDQSSLTNPIDLAGSADADPCVFAKCTEIILDDDGVDALLIVGLFGGYYIRFSETLLDNENKTAKKIAELVNSKGKPVVVHSLYSPTKTIALEHLKAAGVPRYAEIEKCVTCISAVLNYGKVREANKEQLQYGKAEPKQSTLDIIANSPARDSGSLLETEAKDLLKAYGVEIPPHLLVSSEEDAQKAIDTFGDVPLAVKIVSKDILHKSDAGGVKLNVKGIDELKSAYREIIGNAKNYKSNADITGVIVSPMVKKGVEIIIGYMKDDSFGPVIMFGLGGIFVEILKDVSFRSVPMTRKNAESMLEDIKAKDILNGARGEKAVNKKAIVDLIMKISDLVQAHPEITEIDLNPLLANEDGCQIVDARMIIGEEL
ncbi:MAG: CoA-binding protein [Alphaproteobacteria bacterium]|nr:CoA-binding protein [Alphaproteobacteria bacterium]